MSLAFPNKQIKMVLEDFSDFFAHFFFVFYRFQLDHGNVMPVLLLILNGIVAFTTVFIACELGQRISEAFEEIDYTREQFEWYLFPIEIKRVLMMIIVNAQQPVSLECFGRIICTRETLKNVCIEID